MQLLQQPAVGIQPGVQLAHLQTQQVQPRRIVRRAPQQVEQLVRKSGSLVRRSSPGVQQQEGTEGSRLKAAARCLQAAATLLACRCCMLPLPRRLPLLSL